MKPVCLIIDAGTGVGDPSLARIRHKAFEHCWRLGNFGLFRLAAELCPAMVEHGPGTLPVTSATAAAMGGRRMLCQTRLLSTLERTP